MQSISPNIHKMVLCDSSVFVFVCLCRNEDSSKCPLRTMPAADGKWLFICHLNRPKMFVEMDIEVHREGMLIHNRSLLVEMVCKLFYYKLFYYGTCYFFDYNQGSAFNMQKKFRVANSSVPQMHICGLWEEARVPREKTAQNNSTVKFPGP